MAKLGYTWYPKDWGNSESVFELLLSERGLYREFIDLAMLNDNKTEVKKSVWCRKFCVSIEELEIILDKLLSLNLIEIKDNILFIPSCESRLNMVRGGKKGGESKKPIVKPIVKGIDKPFESFEEKKDKPIANQTKREIEIETKNEIKEKINNKNDLIFNELIVSEMWLENTAMQSSKKFTPDQVKEFLKKYNDMINVQFEFKNNKTEYCTHFVYWLNKQEKESITVPKKDNRKRFD